MIFSNDVFLKAIQSRTEAMLKSIESYQSKIHQCEADTAQIGQLSTMFGDPPEPLRSDKDSIHFFIKLVKVKLLNELVLANLKFSADLQDFVHQNKDRLKTLFNQLELLTENDDLSDNFEKIRLISDLKYDLRGADMDLEILEKHYAKLHDLLLDTHTKLVAFVNCYFRKQRRERITLLDLRDGKIKAIKGQLAQLKKNDKNREFRQQIQELEGELLRKCNEIVEKTDLIELILADENESLYYGFHLLNDLSSTLDEIQVKALNLKITLEIVETSDPLDNGGSSGNGQSGQLASSSNGSSTNEQQQQKHSDMPDGSSAGVNLLSNDRTNGQAGDDIWSYKPDDRSLPQEAHILFDGSLTSPLSGVLCAGDTYNQLLAGLDIDRPSSSLASSTDLSFINEQLNGSLSVASSLNGSSLSSFGRSVQSTNASGRSSSATRSLCRSVNSYCGNNNSLARPNGMLAGPLNGLLPTPVPWSANDSLSQSANSFLNARQINPPSFANQPLASDRPPMTYASKLLTNRSLNTNHPLQSQSNNYRAPNQSFNLLINPPINPPTNPPNNNESTNREQPFTGAPVTQFNGRFSVTSNAADQQAKKFTVSNSVPKASDGSGPTATIATTAATTDPPEQQKENVTDTCSKESAKLNTKRCRRQRMAIRDRKLGLFSCEHDQVDLAKEEPHTNQFMDKMLPHINASEPSMPYKQQKQSFGPSANWTSRDGPKWLAHAGPSPADSRRFSTSCASLKPSGSFAPTNRRAFKN